MNGKPSTDLVKLKLVVAIAKLTPCFACQGLHNSSRYSDLDGYILLWGSIWCFHSPFVAQIHAHTQASLTSEIPVHSGTDHHEACALPSSGPLLHPLWHATYVDSGVPFKSGVSTYRQPRHQVETSVLWVSMINNNISSGLGVRLAFYIQAYLTSIFLFLHHGRRCSLCLRCPISNYYIPSWRRHSGVILDHDNDSLRSLHIRTGSLFKGRAIIVSRDPCLSAFVSSRLRRSCFNALIES
jgi:hypothetical protein